METETLKGESDLNTRSRRLRDNSKMLKAGGSRFTLIQKSPRKESRVSKVRQSLKVSGVPGRSVPHFLAFSPLPSGWCLAALVPGCHTGKSEVSDEERGQCGAGGRAGDPSPADDVGRGWPLPFLLLLFLYFLLCVFLLLLSFLFFFFFFFSFCFLGFWVPLALPWPSLRGCPVLQPGRQ